MLEAADGQRDERQACQTGRQCVTTGAACKRVFGVPMQSGAISSGRLPWDAGGPAALVARVVKREPPSDHAVPGVPHGFEDSLCVRQQTHAGLGEGQGFAFAHVQHAAHLSFEGLQRMTHG